MTSRKREAIAAYAALTFWQREHGGFSFCCGLRTILPFTTVILFK
jgi:hypothetical protein